ncbi:hypothetical protein G9A89_008525 [Geosiphon pyriformis]|nr:hypothetical protein G9A89_008525 [Geosiphon pyriformis]
MKKRGILFRSNNNTHGVSESLRPQAYLIETIISSSEIYIKVRSLLRKENILYLYQIQNKDESLMTWMDFTRKYRQNNSSRIPRWFKILEFTIIIDKYRNIKVAQCEALRMHKLTNQIPNDLETIKKIEISTDGSLVKAGSEDARETAAFITHGIEAEFGIAIDGTLSSTKTEAKTVLLALEAVPYRCKLIINTDKNKKADKLAKESTILDTVRWVYNIKKTAYILLCKGVELDLNIRHFLSKQTSLQSALNWIGNNKVQETIGSLNQDIDWIYTTKIWN